MKKWIYGIYIFLFVFSLHLTIRYFLNEVYISKYNNGIYNNNIVDVLHVLNFPQSYVVHYNKGNSLYQEEKYEEAVSEYQEALKTVSGDRRCKVIVNLSFAKFQLVDMDNKDTIVRDLKKIQEILLDHNCATKDNKGKNQDAQNFYNEIEKLLNSSSQQQQQDGDGDDDGGGDGGPDGDEIETILTGQKDESFNERDKVDQQECEVYNGKRW